MPSELIKNLSWRYACKKFDPTKKIRKKDLDELLEALRLSPSSYGMQPWKFLVITDKKLRARLNEHSNQPQVTDASHLIVLCARADLNEEYVRRYVESIAKTRNLSVEPLKAREETIAAAMKRKTQEVREDWAKHQVYIALGMLLSACAAKRIDACPMEGFSAEKFDEVLGLDKKRLKSVVLCPVGYRAKDDKFSKLKKVRFEKKDVFEFL